MIKRKFGLSPISRGYQGFQNMFLSKIIVISKKTLCVTKSYQPSHYVGRFPKNVRVYVIPEMQFYKYVFLFVLFCFMFMYFYYQKESQKITRHQNINKKTCYKNSRYNWYMWKFYNSCIRSGLSSSSIILFSYWQFLIEPILMGNIKNESATPLGNPAEIPFVRPYNDTCISLTY